MQVTKKFQVTGMSCNHCENAIRTELVDIAGISAVEVTAETGNLTVTLNAEEAVSNETILNAVSEAGYEATPAS